MTNPSLAELLRDALERVHDTAYLALHPLAGMIAPGESGTGIQPDQRGMHVRAALLSWIEQMKPASGSDDHSPENRRYQILHMRYVLNQRMWQIETQLSISERQARRDHAQALEAFTALVHSQVAHPNLRMPSVVADGQTSSIQDAVHRLTPVLSTVSLAPLFTNLASMWRRVRQHGVCDLRCQVLPPDLSVCTDRGILTEMLMKLSLSTPDVPSGDPLISLLAERVEQRTVITLESAHDRWHVDSENWQIARMLAQTLGMRLEKILESSPQPTARVVLALPIHADVRRVLVIDDEALSIELVRDYLSTLTYEIAGETSPEAGLHKAIEWRPDVIVLDVMMPGMAGWELLQRIRHTPHLADVPVIVNSVLNDKALALDLGATRFFRKPILRQQLLAALDELLVGQPEGGQCAEQGPQ